MISIDTRKAIVADQAVKAGANIVNDVSGGKYDKDMISTVVSLKSPFVMMHMRGNPDTMTTKAHTQYQDVVCEVAQELQQQLKVVNSCIPKWLQIVDPGIGFAKGYDENMQILKPENLKKLKKMLEYRPLFIGLSRKRFLSRIIDEAKIKRKGLSRLGSEQDWFCSDMTVEDRDFATAGACAAALIGGADILRVHNIKLVTTVCDSLISVLGCNEEYD